VAVEPDNAARYLFSSTRAGAQAFDLSRQFFAAATDARGDDRRSDRTEAAGTVRGSTHRTDRRPDVSRLAHPAAAAVA
jgi:hypothetical protein